MEQFGATASDHLIVKKTAWWHSAQRMRQISRAGAVVAVIGLSIGMWTGTTDLFVAATGFFVGAGGVVCGMFGWFRAEHLREMKNLRQ